MKSSAFAPVALALALAGCATAPPLPQTTAAPAAVGVAERSQVRRPDDASAYGLFLAGAAAFSGDDRKSAAGYFAAAAGRAGDIGFIQERAFTAALMSGDVRTAAALAPTSDAASAPIQRLGRLTRGVESIAEGRGQDAVDALTKPPLEPPFAMSAALLLPWAQAEAGDWKDALADHPSRGERLIDEIARLDRALLLERRGRTSDADAVFRTLLADSDGSGVYTLAYGQFLERRGRRADAVALYQASLKGDPSARAFVDALARAKAARPAPPAPSLSQGAAQALLGPTVVLLSEKEPELGLAYLRLILRLDPDRDEAWLLAGDALSQASDSAGAEEAYARVRPQSLDFVEARARLIGGLEDDQAFTKALEIAQDTVKARPDDDDALTLLADAERVNKDYAASARILDRIITHDDGRAAWQLYYMRGVALEQAGDWPSAEADMKKALELQPDEPEVLNYLGYSWVDRGLNLETAKAMIQKAAAAKPESGAIIDSLGWADFRLGDYAGAVTQLERAAELDPSDPDINNHLGDAYWRVGRRTEARFQWERVLTLEPDPKLKADIERKLRDGLSALGGTVADAGVASAR